MCYGLATMGWANIVSPRCFPRSDQVGALVAKASFQIKGRTPCSDRNLSLERNTKRFELKCSVSVVTRFSIIFRGFVSFSSNTFRVILLPLRAEIRIGSYKYFL